MKEGEISISKRKNGFDKTELARGVQTFEGDIKTEISTLSRGISDKETRS